MKIRGGSPCFMHGKRGQAGGGRVSSKIRFGIFDIAPASPLWINND